MLTFYENVDDMSLPLLLKYFENGPSTFRFMYFHNYSCNNRLCYCHIRSKMDEYLLMLFIS